MLIDHRGIIQHASIRKGLDEEIERLVEIAEGAGMVGDLIEAEQRTFRDKTGDHRIVATAIAREGDNFVLRKEDGSEITVALGDLSKADQRYLRTVDLEEVAPAVEEPAMDVIDEDENDDYRTFSDTSGSYEVEAKFIELIDGKVRLQKLDGSTIDVPLEKLSEEDQQFVRDQG
ncbi:MAG: SHD1 domain-containing protein [Pirellulaceae bacterium]